MKKQQDKTYHNGQFSLKYVRITNILFKNLL